MGRPSRLLESLRTAVEQRASREFAADVFEPSKVLTPDEELEQRRSELQNQATMTEFPLWEAATNSVFGVFAIG
jgi:hypothetical protein